MEKRLDDLAAGGTSGWLRQRIDWQPLAGLLAKKTVPIHRHSWIYLLGGAAMFLFALQAATGCLLMLYYQPAETTAYESVREITTRVPYGWFIRSIHVWGATFFIATAAIHFVTVLFTRAYRKPRELTWVSGILMWFIALTFGFSGYLLPWNELAYYATRVGTEIPNALPGLGEFVVHLMRGGEQVTGATLTRFYAVHVAVLPLALGALLAAHLLLIQVQGLSLPLGMTSREVRDQRPFFSEFLLIDFCVWLLLFGAIASLAVLLPAELGEKADLLKPAPVGIKPEWYFLFLFKTLKMVPEALGVAMFALGALFFFALPFLDRKASRERKSPGFTATFVILFLYAATFEILAWLDPGIQRAPEALGAETYGLGRSIVTLLLFWAVIGFLLFYLRRLLRENARIRTLYRDVEKDP
ncbi:MAG: cytochrome bc complex cytochrome b subunit, partial [Thermoguttaceae bacterium]